MCSFDRCKTGNGASGRRRRLQSSRRARDAKIQMGGRGMAYIFNEDQLPRLLSNGRERVFFVNKELNKIDDMLAGIMHYKQGAESPYHLHKNCEHFYFIMEGRATVQT